MTDLLTYGSLFSGGGGLDMGLDAAGLNCVFQVENDKHCLTLLNRHWPDVPKNEIRPCVGLVGGDPCPIRSQASYMSKTLSPDMSGYFLAMMGRCKPRWVLRENVPAPDVSEFTAGLGVLRYRTVIVEANSAAFTGQSRCREFVVAFDKQDTLDRFIDACNDTESDQGYGAACGSARGQVLPCLTGRKGQSQRSEVYVYEGPQRGLRILSHAERESLQGWGCGWTDGLPDSARSRIVGNGVTAPVAQWIGERIRTALRNGSG